MKENFKNNLERGQAMLIATVFFLIVSLTIILGLAAPTVRAQKMTRELFFSRQSYYLAEAGLEDVVYRLRRGLQVGNSETLSLGGASATTVTVETSEGRDILAVGESEDTVRKVATELVFGDGVAFHYGIQIGNGGFTLANNAGVNGNIYSNGSVSGSAGSFITGSVSAVGSISGVTVGTGVVGDANAPTVTNTTVRGKLYCKSGSGNNKPCDTSGTNPAPASLPIADGQINAWKAEAEAGGTFAGQSYSGTSNVVGPKKISGNVTLNGGALLRLTGTLWITGNLTLSNGAEVELDPSYGAGDGIVIVDGVTLLSNNSIFRGSGEEDSLVMILSTNAGSNAITLQNNAGAAILYAPNGTVQIANNAGINSVTANTVSLQNNAIIDYEQGLVEASFVNGPSGGYDIREWKEVQ